MTPAYVLAAQERAQFLELYAKTRAANPLVPARKILAWLKDEGGEPLEQFLCAHDWVISEETDRCYCCLCGADGDA